MSAKRFALAIVASGLCLRAAAAEDYRVPSFSSATILNAATGQPGLAPYSICTIYGTDLFLNGTAGASGRTDVPNSLAGVTVLFGRVPVGILYVSSNQINFLIPNSLTPGTYSVAVVRDGIGSQSVPVSVQEVAPGLFTSEPGFAVALHSDGSPVTADSPAVPGEVVMFYATGFGRTAPDPTDRSIAQSVATIIHSPDFQVRLDGVGIPASLVQYVGLAPFNAGLYQVNVRLPDGLSPANPEVQVSVAGVLSPAGVKLMTARVGQINN
jgi:uncharacterized protein (TIGR03437 family)